MELPRDRLKKPFANQQLTADVAGEAAAPVGSRARPAAGVRAVLVLPTVLPNSGNAAELGSVKAGEQAVRGAYRLTLRRYHTQEVAGSSPASSI